MYTPPWSTWTFWFCIAASHNHTVSFFSTQCLPMTFSTLFISLSSHIHHVTMPSVVFLTTHDQNAGIKIKNMHTTGKLAVLNEQRRTKPTNRKRPEEHQTPDDNTELRIKALNNPYTILLKCHSDQTSETARRDSPRQGASRVAQRLRNTPRAGSDKHPLLIKNEHVKVKKATFTLLLGHAHITYILSLWVIWMSHRRRD